MPLYEYEHKGKACALGKAFEYIQPMNEAPLNLCPECGGPVSRIISGARLNFRKERRKKRKSKSRGINLIGDD